MKKESFNHSLCPVCGSTQPCSCQKKGTDPYLESFYLVKWVGKQNRPQPDPYEFITDPEYSVYQFHFDIMIEVPQQRLKTIAENIRMKIPVYQQHFGPQHSDFCIIHERLKSSQTTKKLFEKEFCFLSDNEFHQLFDLCS